MAEKLNQSESPRAGVLTTTAAALSLAASSVSAATDEAIKDRYCEALANDAFVVERLSEDELAEIGVTQRRLSPAEINVMSDADYYGWWNAVINKTEVTAQYEAGRPVDSLVVSLEGLDAFSESFYHRIQELCPEVGAEVIIQPAVVTTGGVDVGAFPPGVEPVMANSGAERLIGIPYLPNGDVDVTHDFWTVESNLIAIGIPLKADGSVERTALDSNNLIHVAWALSAQHRAREARAEAARVGDERLAATEAALEVARDLLAIARGEAPTTN